MDKNKLKTLKENHYKINDCCHFCKHSIFKSDFGICKIITYKHLKHNESERQLSIHTTGVCKMYEVDEIRLMAIHAFKQLMGL